MSFVGFIVIILTHMGTYTVALTLPRVLTQPSEQATSTTKQQPVSQATTSTGNAAAALVRIGQAEITQYTNQAEHDQWWASACSTASMTEILDAWWGYARYRITDVLRQEVAANAISPAEGLLDNDGIARTMRRFGFDTQTPQLTLDQVIATANSGIPVIAGWPPEKYQGGHLIVVTGGTATTVKIADSSLYNRKTLSRAQFLAWWGGFTAISKPNSYSLYSVGHPTLSPTFINSVLTAYHSPMRGLGQDIYNMLAHYHLDPAIALAFYLHESSMGTTGEARTTRAWGNSRCIPNARCIDQDRGGYAAFDTWTQGLQEWCWQITDELYAAGGKVLVDDIIPTYAPTADGNDESSYIAALKHAADTWRSGKTIVH